MPDGAVGVRGDRGGVGRGVVRRLMGLPVIYRCPRKRCGAVARKVWATEGTIRRSGFRGDSYEVRAFGFVVDHRFYAHTEASRWGLAPECPDHGPMVAAPVVGTHNDRVRCDARCQSAKGPNCECSCGGANHGAAHDLPAVASV